ncbi:hypothetical protein VU08_06395 [Desulfobulbus sp. F5]|nr:hypothetical protein [Desulfobulbus sp. F5]
MAEGVLCAAGSASQRIEEKRMTTLQLEGIDSFFYDQIKQMAELENRSVSQQIVHVVKEYLAKEKQIRTTRSPADVLLELAGSWQDSRDADEIISEIRSSRRNSTRFDQIF